jgi:hypothetical protein
LTPALLPIRQNDTPILSATPARNASRSVQSKVANSIMSTSDPTFALIEKVQVAYEKFMADKSDSNCDIFTAAFGELERTPSTTREGMFAKLDYVTSNPERNFRELTLMSRNIWMNHLLGCIAIIRANGGGNVAVGKLLEIHP